MKQFTAELFFTPPTEELRYLPECPRVLHNGSHSPDRTLLGWVAIVHRPGGAVGSLEILDCGTLENRSIALPGRPGFFAETSEKDVVVVGLDRRLVLVHTVTGEVRETGLTIPFDDERVIINDGMAVPGGLLFGTKHLEFNQPIAALYHLDCATRSIRELIPGQYCSNGKYLFAGEDGQSVHLIDTDSIPRKLTRYIFRDHRFSEQVAPPALLVDPKSLPSIPDGLRHDAEGESIVIAYFNPELVSDGLAQQLGVTNGEVLSAWRIPGSPRVTCPELLWKDGKVKVLFTSAAEGMTSAHRSLAPHAGCFFLADTPFSKLPEPPPLVNLTV